MIDGNVKAPSAVDRAVVLIVEDDVATREVLAELLASTNCDVLQAGSGAQALQILDRRDVEVVLLDLGLPDVSGLELLPRILEQDESVAVIVVTGDSTTETVVEAMRLGADGFLVKPVTAATLTGTLAQAVRRHRLQRHAAVYRERVASRGNESGIRELIGSSPAMDRVRELIAKVAGTDSPVLVTGESGTGKGVVARLIHRYSRRAHGPFVDLSCAALPGPLVESELFGHERGAFTDAKSAKPGMIEIADGGTLFLDEIAELEGAAQAKLLKAVEERAIRRIGGIRERRVNVRFVVATHRDLAKLMAEGRFRSDLFFRLNVFGIEIPPLRKRGSGDIAELADHFVKVLNPELGRQIRSISEPVLRALVQYEWPGNVRELRNAIERAMILAPGEKIEVHHLPPDLWQRRSGAVSQPPSGGLEHAEVEAIRNAITACGGNLSQAARVLGIARSTLYAKVARYRRQTDRGARH